jgi:hypothetical protein
MQVSRSIGDVYLKRPQYNTERIKPKFRTSEPFSRPILSANPYVVSLKDREDDQRGGEWESIKILQENLAYTPNLSRNPSLLARPRPPSYRLAIGPRNCARNRT